MSCLYVTEQGSKISIGDGRFIVEAKNGERTTIPEETLESIVVFGNVSMTTPAQKACLQRGVKVTYLSTRGHYYGRLESTSSVNPERLKKQVYLSDNEEQCVKFARIVLKAKIHNQMVLLRRYARTYPADIQSEISDISYYEKKMDTASEIQELMGYEGISARNYFSGLAKMVKGDFAFDGRTKRPPRDPFNALLSIGYTILFYEIYGELENRGLSPYVGLTHKMKYNHPALASDLLEEWRAPIVDAVVMSLVQGNEIGIEEFSTDEDSGGVVVSEKGV